MQKSHGGALVNSDLADHWSRSRHSFLRKNKKKFVDVLLEEHIWLLGDSSLRSKTHGVDLGRLASFGLGTG